MAVNVKKNTAAGLEIAHYGAVDSLGYLIGSTLTAPAAGNADGSPMLELEGPKNFPFRPVDPEKVVVTGGDRPLSKFQFKPADFPELSASFGTNDHTFAALAQGTIARDLGGLTLSQVQPSDADYPDLMFIVQGQAKSRATGSRGSKMWEGLVVPKVNCVPLFRDAFAERAAAEYAYSLIANPVDVYPWGEALADADEGTTETVGFYFTSPYRMHMHRFTGNNTAVAFNLDYTPAEASGTNVLVWVNGVLQVYTTAYTVNVGTKVLTFEAGSVPANDSKIVVWFGYTLS